MNLSTTQKALQGIDLNLKADPTEGGEPLEGSGFEDEPTEEEQAVQDTNTDTGE